MRFVCKLELCNLYWNFIIKSVSQTNSFIRDQQQQPIAKITSKKAFHLYFVKPSEKFLILMTTSPLLQAPVPIFKEVLLLCDLHHHRVCPAGNLRWAQCIQQGKYFHCCRWIFIGSLSIEPRWVTKITKSKNNYRVSQSDCWNAAGASSRHFLCLEIVFTVSGLPEYYSIFHFPSSVLRHTSTSQFSPVHPRKAEYNTWQQHNPVQPTSIHYSSVHPRAGQYSQIQPSTSQ